MQFDKPKVTIDLEEYQYIIEQNKKLQSASFYTAAQIILFGIHRLGSDIKSLRQYLLEYGIEYTMYTSSPIGCLSHESVSIDFKPPKNNQ